MSTGDVPRCPNCGMYCYPGEIGHHVCWNAPASYPLQFSEVDWRDGEIERLRAIYNTATLEREAAIRREDDLRARLEEAERLLRDIADLGLTYGDVSSRLDAFLAGEKP